MLHCNVKSRAFMSHVGSWRSRIISAKHLDCLLSLEQTRESPRFTLLVGLNNQNRCQKKRRLNTKNFMSEFSWRLTHKLLQRNKIEKNRRDKNKTLRRASIPISIQKPTHECLPFWRILDTRAPSLHIANCANCANCASLILSFADSTLHCCRARLKALWAAKATCGECFAAQASNFMSSCVFRR